MAEGYKYWAFISYSHQDRAWGDWLHKTLETYQVPSRLVGRESRDGQVPKRLFPIFRDRDELPSSANLGDVLNESLRQSRYQIVICSPRAAASRWVNEEVKYFKSLGREDRVLCLIVDGEPHVADVPGREQEECFAPALRYRVDRSGTLTEQPAEPIAADAREHADGKRGAKLKLLSGLLGVGYDELVQRERQRQLWQRVQAGFASAAMIALCMGAWQWYLHQREAREREITIEKLVENGRQELLAGQQARAAVYLNEAYKMGDDSVPLRFMLAQAMKPVEALTDVRVEHGGVAVYKSAFSPDGKRFALHVLTKGTGDQAAVVKIYSADTGAQLVELPGVPVLPLQMAFIGEGKRLLISGFPDDNRGGEASTEIWDLDDPAHTVKLRGQAGLAGSPMSQDGSRVLIADPHGVHVHETSSGALLQTLVPMSDARAASFSPDGMRVAIADASGVIRIVSSADGATVGGLTEARGENVAALMYTPDGEHLLALYGRRDMPQMSGDVRIWNLQTGLLELALAVEPQILTELQFDRSGRRFLTVGAEGYKVWSTARGILLFAVPRVLEPYASAALSADGNTFATADFRSKVSEVWDVRAKRKLYSLDVHADGVSSAMFNPDGHRLLLASRDGSAELWRMPVTPDWKYESFETLPYAAHFSADGGEVLAGGGDYSSGSLLLLSASDGTLKRTIPGHSGVVYSAQFSPEGRHIASASRDGTAGIWDVKAGVRLAELIHNDTGTVSAVYCCSGTRLLTASDTTVIAERDAAVLWDAESGRRIARLEHEGAIWATALDGTFRRIATGDVSGTVKVWSATNGELLRSFQAHKGIVRSLRFSGDGAHLLSASDDSVVTIWKVASGTVMKQVKEPGLGGLYRVQYSPDERRIAIATQSGIIGLWLLDEDRILSVKGHQDLVTDLRFTDDGRVLFSAGADGTVKAWDVAADAIRELGVQLALNTSVTALDLDNQGGALVASTWGQVHRVSVGPELRASAELSQILSCNVPWRLNLESVGLEAAARLDCRRPHSS